MIRSANWNILISVIGTITVITVIAFWQLQSFVRVEESVSTLQFANESIIRANNIAADESSIYSWFIWSSSSSGEIYLPSGRELSLEIPAGVIEAWMHLEVNKNPVEDTSQLQVEIENLDRVDSQQNTSLNTKGWFLLYDTSVWSLSDKTENIEIQKEYLRNSSIEDLSSFIETEIGKTWEQGSYFIIDLLKKRTINKFSFNLTTEGKSNHPDVLQITLDDWLQYLYWVRWVVWTQEFLFPDSKTQYIKLDFISSSNWEVTWINGWVANNLSWNITSWDISYSQIWVNEFNVSINNTSSITGLEFMNIYTWRWGYISERPFLTLLPSENEFIYNSATSNSEIYIELCSWIKACNPKIKKLISN